MKRNGRIRRIEWDISWKWMKRQRAYCRILLCVAVLACVLLQMGFLITDGITETLLQHRKDIYGEWEQCLADVDAESETIVQRNPFLTSRGVVRNYGVLGGNYWENKQLNIGTIDETAWSLGHLQMLRGRLPEKEDEIALEYSTLTALGYEGTVGEKISLNIISTTERQKEQPETIHTYTLCGVIKDYQINWDICSYERFPTGILTEDGAKQIGGPLQTHMLLRADQNAETVYKDLKNSSKVTCSMEENVKWEEAAVEQILYLRFLKSLRLLTAAGAFCILHLVVSKSVEKRQEMWEILDALGMTRRQMYGILFWETAVCFLLSALIGSVIGTCHSTEIRDTDFTIDLSAYKESAYVQKVLEVERIFEGEVTLEQMHLHALGIDRWEDLQRFLTEIQEGTVTKEQFESGDFCILVFAPLREQDGIYLPWSIKETVRESDIQEEEVGVGDKISIAYHGGKETQKKELRVDAILRVSSEQNMYVPYPSGSGIYMITGKGFWKQYGIDTVDEECQIVRVLLKDTADVYDTETHILGCVKKAGHIQVTNYHEEYQVQQQEYYSLAATLAVFGIFYGIMVVIVVRQLRETEKQDKDRNYQIWKALGMEDSFIRKVGRVEIGLECAIAVAAGAVMVLGYYLVLIKM